MTQDTTGNPRDERSDAPTPDNPTPDTPSPDNPTMANQTPTSQVPTDQTADTANAPAANQTPAPADAPTPTSTLSLADIERRRSRPIVWIVYGVVVLVAMIVPYWAGRMIASRHVQWAIDLLSSYEPRGIALLSWAVTVCALTGLGLMVVESHNWLWRIVFVVGLAAEQFIGGLCILRLNFWYATRVIYGDSAGVANAADLGIIAAGVAVAVYAVVFVGLLVVIRKDSPLNVLTRSWASFLLFFAIEVIALCVVLFGGLLTAV